MPTTTVLKRLLIKAYVIWDFDDAILTSGELGNKEWKMLQKYSNKIVLLNSYCTRLPFITSSSGYGSTYNLSDISMLS